MDFNEIAVFVKVVQTGSFSAAARQLDLPTSTISTRISRLEKRLGIALLLRTTRRLSLTEVGQLYFQQASTGLAFMLEAETVVAASVSEPQGLLRVTAPADFGDTLFTGLICEVRRIYPKINIELTLTDRYVDLIAEGTDVAIRIGVLQDSSLVAKRVGIACWALFASPDYLRSAPSLTRPQNLQNHQCLQFTTLGKNEWTLFHAKDSVTVPLAGQVIVNDIGVIRSMALACKGVALLPTYLCHTEVQEGKLVRVMPEWHARSDSVYLVYPGQKFMPAKLRVFMDMAALELKRWLE